MTAAKFCRKCGAVIPLDSPQQSCGACLLETGLGADESDREVNVDSALSPMLMDFGDYELLEQIGRGGQGVVFRARQKSLNRIVALKVIAVGRWATEVHVKRFRREAEAAASLEHPHIVPIHEVGERDGSCYFSMKFVEGGQLNEVVRRSPMSIRQAAELIAKVARTVHYAHEHGILHRDIKPGNILLDAKGEPHLTDFGLARLVETESTVTRTLEVMGTPSYMAPEQAVGSNAAVNSTTDVYGLGAVFYELLTGHPPFAGGTTYQTIKLLLDTEPRQPRLWNRKIDRDLSTICLKCLEKDSERRYASALALAEDLERWLKHEPIAARRTGLLTRGRKWVRRNPSIAVMAAMLLALAVPLAVMVWKSEFPRQPVTTGIAVLPFENLSDQKENAFFADGVQDDILTKLAKIADLKVICRTSVMPYRGKQDVRQVGDALRVSHVLEGTVRRFGGKVHINAQLVDARTDAGIWAEEYDRDLNDVFAVETEVAQSIANRLRAKVSTREKMAMQEWPTKDLVAYDVYVRAMVLIEKASLAGLVDFKSSREKDLLQAVDLLNQAVARDPAFVLAYCWLAKAHNTLYFDNFDPTPGRLALAKSAIDSAFRLNPDSGEAHLALALHLYWGYFDYDRARAELAIAQRALPNNPRAFELAGWIDRRQGRWSDAVRNLERASELDPRSTFTLTNLASTYCLLHDWQQARDVMDRLLIINPNDIGVRLDRAGLAIGERADTRPLRSEIQKILADDPAQAENQAVKGQRFVLVLFDRDLVAGGRAAEALPEKNSLNDDFEYSRAFWTGVVARIKGDDGAARGAFSIARAQQETLVGAKPDSGTLLSALGVIDAGLGQKEEALREGRHAKELTPVAKDAMLGAQVISNLALICTWTGEQDLAIEQLEIAAKLPAGPDYGDLRLNPMWDSLRRDPRFEKIVASLAPKEN